MNLASLADADRRLLADYWWQRAAGERTSWWGFRQARQDLERLGVSEQVLALADRSVDDEYLHSEWCGEWAVRFGHPGGEIRVRDERPLTFPGAPAEHQGLLRVAFLALTETVGCHVLTSARPSLVDVELRAQNRRHLSDEVRHARVGWSALAELGRPSLAPLGRYWSRLLEALVQLHDGDSELERGDLVAYGYFSRSLLLEATDRALVEVIVPGLRHLGFEVEVPRELARSRARRMEVAA